MSWLFNGINLGYKLAEIKRDELVVNQITDSQLTIQDFKSVGSYNWSKQSTPYCPIIIVPGKADKLKKANKIEIKQLNKSQFTQIIDENRYYHPVFPIEPLFRAVQVCTPQFDFGVVDFVTDRNNLRKLLNFVEDRQSEQGEENRTAFRIDFQCVGNMVVLVRVEEKANDTCNDFGKDFEKNCTENGLDEGAYRRIVSYKFGDFSFLVRFEVDCVMESVEQPPTKMDIEDELVASMENVMKLKEWKEWKKGAKSFETPTTSQLKYVRFGQFNANEKLVELSTKSTFSNEFPKHKWNQLFFSQTNVFVLGWHRRGYLSGFQRVAIFHYLQIYKLQEIEMLTFDQVTQRSGRCNDGHKTVTNLAKLHDLLARIRNIAFINRNVVFSLVFDGNTDGRMTIYTCSSNACLPEAYLHSFKTPII